MNILLATDDNLVLGGITLFMLQWIRGIKEADPDSDVYVYFRAGIKSREIEKEYRTLGVHIITGNVPRSISFKDPKARQKVLKDINALMKKEEFDVVHVNSGVFGYTADILSEAKRQSIPVRISHSHGAYPERWHDKIVHFFLRRRIKAAATVYAGCSEKAGRYLFGERGVKSLKWRMIPNTIQTERFLFDESSRKRYREIMGVHEDEVLIGAVGQLREVKNYSFLLDLIADINKKGFPGKLVIIGEGDEREKLEKKIAELGIRDCTILYGQTKDVSGVLCAMDYYLMPSLSEGFPISAIEAQANGLTCLLSDRVSTEVDITKNVYHLSIDHGTESWIDILEHTIPAASDERKKAVLLVKQAGFDQNDTAHYVKKLYSIEAK